jgi:hypothetical protein
LVSLSLRDEHGLGAFKNRVMTIFGPKREKVTKKWGRLHSVETSQFVIFTEYYPGGYIKNRWVRNVAHMGWRGAFWVLVGKREGKRSLRKAKRRQGK